MCKLQSEPEKLYQRLKMLLQDSLLDIQQLTALFFSHNINIDRLAGWKYFSGCNDDTSKSIRHYDLLTVETSLEAQIKLSIGCNSD